VHQSEKESMSSSYGSRNSSTSLPDSFTIDFDSTTSNVDTYADRGGSSNSSSRPRIPKTTRSTTTARLHPSAASPSGAPTTKPIEEPKSTKQALKSLFAVDCIRGNRLLETIQFAIIYGALAIFIGAGIDGLFDKWQPVDRKKKLSTKGFAINLGICLAQVTVSALAVFYMRKLIAVVPPLINLCPSRYVPHAGVHEFEGEIAVAMIFIGVQTSFISRLEMLRTFIVGGASSPEE